jgi:hypothetical protein
MRATPSRSLFAAGLCASLGASAALAVPSALAGSGDAAATQTYVQANYALVRVADVHLKTSEAAPLEVLAGVRRQCPNAGAGSPQDPESTEMSNEVIGAMVLSAGRPDRPAIGKFIRTVARLHWSSASLTRAVSDYAGKLKTLLSLPTPDLCADVRAWAASGYRTLPADTVAFDAKFMPAWVALGSLPRQLAAGESPATRSLRHRAERIEAALADGEARAVAHYTLIMNALTLWP